ncbi:nephrin-like [Ruditapes philippinarum]|uniref:nephrin-like n=1 Tax=Ruditapes philippinarum TaxID=129788 RepID=UPI00295B90D7|nr:nephrin-like [Ruditapes philippinarum]
MKNWKFHLSMLALCFIQGISCQSIVLTPTNAYANINEALTFTCTYIAYTNVAGTKWRVNNQHTPYIVRHQDNTCSGSGIFTDDKIYRVGCPSDTSFTVTILRVQQEDLNTQWRCLDLDRTSNTVKILLKVSVANVVLSGPSSSFMKEHSQQTIKCKTSPGRPQPRVSWYLFEKNKSVKHKITVNVSTQIINDSGDGLVTVESTLQFHPNRSINNWMLNCEAWTDDETSAVLSNRLTLNIAYPPEKPVIIGFTDGEKYSLIESEFGKLSCSSHGGNPLANLTWNCYDSKPTSISNEDKTVFSTVTWSGFRGQSSCLCISHHSWSGTTQNTTVMIDVLYPPNKPTMTISNKTVSNVINVILSKTVLVKCESKSNPRSNYTWTGPADLSKTKQILDVTINNTIDKMFKCMATNRMVRQNGTHVDGHNESAVTIKVLYPPGNPYFKYEYSNGTKVSTQNMIDVIAGDSFSIHCNAAGNPLPTYKWDSNEGNGILKITSITSDTNKTCHAKNIMEETVGESRTVSTSASFSIRVLHAPYIPTITISNGTRQFNITAATIQLRETDNINMTCFSEGKPLPKYTWDSHNDPVQGRIRQFTNISRKDAGNYTCYASNLMKRTFGDSEQGLNISNLSLDIMYPSTLSSLVDISILEGSDLNVICRVQKGNPTEESVSWTRISDDKNWKNSQLIIANVSRADDTQYTCTLRSTIIPTIGHETLTIRSKTIHLSVFFSSEIKHFTVVKDKSSGTFIVNQRDEVSLECTAEANPVSDLSIYNTSGKRISSVKNRNVLLYSINNASYENAGKYKCEGRNNYTKDKPSVSELTMIVKCSPRPSLDSIFPNKIAAAQYTNKTMNFVAYEYLDEENKTEFMWFHKNIAIERSDEKFEIFTIGLNSSLSVRNITQIDFGEYSVKVSNTIGEYTHHFMLQAEDKPDMPKDLTYKLGSITESSVILVWTPGFNGGFPQTFILLYHISHKETLHSVQVHDTNEQTISYTLTNLLSSKTYNIRMFAMNKKGNSSNTKTLQLTTNASASDLQPVVYKTSTGTFVGVGVGTFAGTITIVAIFLFCYRRVRKNKHNAGKQDIEGKVTGPVYNSHSPYEDLDSTKKDGNVYAQVVTNNLYAQSNSTIMQELSTLPDYNNSMDKESETSVYINMKI